jgi:hypothetical protein
MMSSPDLETGLARLIRYNGIVSGASTISFEPAKGGKWTRVELFLATDLRFPVNAKITSR